MKSRKYDRMQNKLQGEIIDFWIKHDVRPEWMLKMLLQSSSIFVPKIDEYYENRTDYDHAEKFENIREIWNDSEISPEVKQGKINGLVKSSEEEN